MEKRFKLDILTPTGKFFSGESEMVIAKTPRGEIGVLSGHLPMVAAIAPGPMKIFAGEKRLRALLSEGFMAVSPEKTVVLVDTAEWPSDTKDPAKTE